MNPRDRERTLAMIWTCAQHQNVGPAYLELDALGRAPVDVVTATGDGRIHVESDRGIEGARAL